MKRARLWLARSVLPLAMGCSTLAFGSSIEELQASGHLRIDSALTPSERIVPGQKVTLTLEIATDRWFTGGTRIGLPEVPGLVILQTEQFASNASETRNGQPWVIQRWSLDVFPQRAGEFTIGPIALQLQVNAGEADDVKGEGHSPSRHFSVAIPDSLTQIDQWVAAPAFSVRQNFDRALDDLSVGDAFEQEIVFEASDVLAMMLPTYAIEQQPGLRAYPAPPVLDNSVNRGQTLASHRIHISYVVEKAGQYVLPARDYFWWNTQNAELEILSLPETRIDVIGVKPSQKNATTTMRLTPQQLLTLLVSLMILATTVRMAWIYLPRLPMARAAALLSNLILRWQTLRKPALATRLNPGSNAED